MHAYRSRSGDAHKIRGREVMTLNSALSNCKAGSTSF
jgi:hypothetical protein